jgi:hypothetical protein
LLVDMPMEKSTASAANVPLARIPCMIVRVFVAQPTPAAFAGGGRPFPVYMTQATLAIRETSGYHLA